MAQYYTNEGRTIARRIGFLLTGVVSSPLFSHLPEVHRMAVHEFTRKRLCHKRYSPSRLVPQRQKPTGDHDRQSGEGITPEEYTLIKYKLNDKVFCQRQLFVQKLSMASRTSGLIQTRLMQKLTWMANAGLLASKPPRNLKSRSTQSASSASSRAKSIGKYVENPLTHQHFPILPGWFVTLKSPQVSSTVFPHAPFDYLALKDLQEKPELLKGFNIDPQMVKAIKPVSIIKVEGFGEFPAIEIVEKMGIVDQNDPRADEATNTVYKKEFHSGVLKANCGPYAGKTIREAKDIPIKDFKQAGIATSI